MPDELPAVRGALGQDERRCFLCSKQSRCSAVKQSAAAAPGHAQPTVSLAELPATLRDKVVWWLL